MRTRLMAPVVLTLLIPTLAWAAGRPATETCVNAGYRVGSTGFDMCVARMGGDDPLAGLESGQLGSHGDGERKPAEVDPLAAIVPARPPLPGGAVTVPAVREDLPASFNAPSVWAPAPLGSGLSSLPGAPSPSPVGQGTWWPTPPTAPTLPAVVAPNAPLWNFDSQ